MSIFTATKELAVKVGAETTGSNVTDILNNIAEAYGATKKGGNAEEAIKLIAEHAEGGGGSWSDEEVSLIPTMLNYTVPYGEVIYSSNYISGENESRLAWYAFDGVDAQTYSSNAWGDNQTLLSEDPDTTAYVGYVFPDGVVVKATSVEIATYSDRVYNGIVQARINGEWQTIVDEYEMFNHGDRYYKSILPLGTPVICSGIRVCVTGGAEEYMSSGSYGGTICEIVLKGYTKE